ncbi:MAG: hypothetical protein AAGA18_00555 [Verrucomicrobiota bacterium]
MSKASVKDLKPGMKLAKEVRDASDALLIPDGAELTEKHIEVLINRDISAVEIEGGLANIRDQCEPELITKVEQELITNLIGNLEDDTTLKTIVDKCVDQTLKKRIQDN